MTAAATPWAEAAIAIAGIALVVTIVWLIFATGRTAISHTASQDYREFAEQASQREEDHTKALTALQEELRLVSERTAELERLLKSVE